MSIPADKVPFGFRTVGAEEKKRLVHDQFTPIAGTYDRADALLSLGLHFLWKRATVRRLGLRPGQSVLDVCGGTADLALRAAKRLGRPGRAVVCDFNRPMMETGRRKSGRARNGAIVAFVQGDAESLPFPDASFDAATVGFGLRNLVDLDRGIGEIFRVLKPGGRFSALEFSLPRRRWQRSLYAFYSFRLMLPGRPPDHRHGRPVPLSRRIHPRFRPARRRRPTPRPGRIRRHRLQRLSRSASPPSIPGASPRRSSMPRIDAEARATAAQCRHYAMCKIDYLGDRALPVRPGEALRHLLSPGPHGPRIGAWPRADPGHGGAGSSRPIPARSAASATRQCHFVTGMQPTAVMRALKDYVADHRREGARSSGRPRTSPAAAPEHRRPGLGASNDPAVLWTYADDPFPLAGPQMPRYVVLPGSRDEVAAVVRLASESRPALRHPRQRRQRLRLRLHRRHRPRHEPDAADRVRPRELVRRRRAGRDLVRAPAGSVPARPPRQRRRAGGHGLRQHRLHRHVLDLVQRLRHGRRQLHRHGVRRPRRRRLPAQRQAGARTTSPSSTGSCPRPASAPRPWSSSTR